MTCLKAISDYLLMLQHQKYGGGSRGNDGLPRGGGFGSSAPLSVDLIDLDIFAERVLRSVISDTGHKMPARGVTTRALAEAMRRTPSLVDSVEGNPGLLHRLAELQAALSARLPHSSTDAPAAIFLTPARAAKSIAKSGRECSADDVQHMISDGSIKSYRTPAGVLVDLWEVDNFLQKQQGTAPELAEDQAGGACA